MYHRSKDAPLSQLVHPDLPKGANHVKSIARSAIVEIARIKSLEDGFGSVSIVKIDFYCHVKIEGNVPNQTTIFRCQPKWNNDSNKLIETNLTYAYSLHTCTYRRLLVHIGWPVK